MWVVVNVAMAGETHGFEILRCKEQFAELAACVVNIICPLRVFERKPVEQIHFGASLAKWMLNQVAHPDRGVEPEPAGLEL